MISPIEPLTDIRTGTSGYDYPEWEGILYSKGFGRKECLGVYSEVFNTLELDFSYCGMPKSENIREFMACTRTPNHDDERRVGLCVVDMPRVEAMSTQSKRLRVHFNNHREGFAATNAKEPGVCDRGETHISIRSTYT